MQVREISERLKSEAAIMRVSRLFATFVPNKNIFKW